MTRDPETEGPVDPGSCPACGAALPDAEAIYCPSCGHGLASDHLTDAVSVSRHLAARPIESSAPVMEVVEHLLKSPGTVVARIREGAAGRVLLVLLVVVIVAHAAYGLIVGSFSGGAQWYYAPAKVVGGCLLCGLICLPSLFIFACLSGADIRIAQAAALMLAMLALTAVLLIGFAPVAWIFSQSTDSVFFMGLLHLIFWVISIRFGFRLLAEALTALRARTLGYGRLWTWILLLTMLQMMTTLRPLLAPAADRPFETRKQFFVSNWLETLEQDK
jgi:hypothetical protein